MASGAWRYRYNKLTWIDSKPRKVFTQNNGRKYLDLSQTVQDLNFKFETYSPPPRKMNGVPFWEKVVPYNACYLPQGDARVCHKTLDPVDMWMEDRWVLLRRIYGSELIQKLFMQCLTFIYGCNDTKGSYFHEIQDTIVTDLFDQDQRSFFDKINKNTWFIIGITVARETFRRIRPIT